MLKSHTMVLQAEILDWTFLYVPSYEISGETAQTHTNPGYSPMR